MDRDAQCLAQRMLERWLTCKQITEFTYIKLSLDSLLMGHNPRPWIWPLRCPAASLLSNFTSRSISPLRLQPLGHFISLPRVLKAFQGSLSRLEGSSYQPGEPLLIPQIPPSQMPPPRGNVSGSASIVSVFYSLGPSSTSLCIPY